MHLLQDCLTYERHLIYMGISKLKNFEYNLKIIIFRYQAHIMTMSTKVNHFQL